MLDNASEMKQFIVLQQKTLLELQTIAESLGLQILDNKELIIRALMDQKKPAQKDLQENTLLALTLPNEDARDLMLQWRKNIYNQGQYKPYTFVNSKGQKYVQEFKRILLSSDSIQKLIDLKMIVPKDYTKDAFEALSQHPEGFNVSLILKRCQTTTFLMVCVQRKSAA